jgi:hypothetical protein
VKRLLLRVVDRYGGGVICNSATCICMVGITIGVIP